MSLFGALVKTVVNTALLPVAIAADVVTLGGKALGDGESFTEKQIETLKREANED